MPASLLSSKSLPTDLEKESAPSPTMPPKRANEFAFSVTTRLNPSRLMPERKNCSCTPVMPLAVNAPTCPSSLKVFAVLSSWSMINLLASAVALTPAASASPANGMDFASPDIALLTVSISGFRVAKLVAPSPTALPNPPMLLSVSFAPCLAAELNACTPTSAFLALSPNLFRSPAPR